MKSQFILRGFFIIIILSGCGTEEVFKIEDKDENQKLPEILSTRWLELPARFSGGSGRFHSVAVDTKRNRLFVHGKVDPTFGAGDYVDYQTKSWDFSSSTFYNTYSWLVGKGGTPIPRDGSLPAPSDPMSKQGPQYGRLIYDVQADTLWLFETGLQGPEGRYTKNWFLPPDAELTHNLWIEKSITNNVAFFKFYYDESKNQARGLGYTYSNSTDFNSSEGQHAMYRWNGHQWQFIKEFPRPPGDVFEFDQRRRVLVSYHTSDAAIWELDENDEEWKLSDVIGPSQRVGLSMYYDPGSKRILFMGGKSFTQYIYSDLYAFDGKSLDYLGEGIYSWRHNMIYDSGNERLLVFGGTSCSWVTDPCHWQNIWGLYLKLQ